MIPKSFSATALQVHELCPARYKAEQIDRSRGFGNVAASTGSTVHNGLELFVKACFIYKTHEPTLELLKELYHLSFVQIFNSHNRDADEYVDGLELIVNWYKRAIVKEDYFNQIHGVISAEVKTFFNVPTSIGDIPFNYIWDRFDEIRPGEFKVVDYKTNRWNIRPSDLQKKIQARCYSLAAAIQLKAQGVVPERVWVEFDMLRHTPSGRVFTYEDNVATWNFLKESAEKILATPDDEVEERLNPECRFCVRKAACNALQKNILVGGVHSLTFDQKINVRAQIEFQKAGLEALANEIDTVVLAEAKKMDIDTYEADMAVMNLTVSRQRAVDAEMVEKVLGPSLFEKYGSKGITMGSVDKLLKGKELTAESKAELRSLIYDKTGEPKVKFFPKNPIDD